MIYDRLEELIGHTPMLRLHKYAEAAGLDYVPLAKLEYLNPAGSVKDRTALFMINDAEERGLLKLGGTIIEPTSGNTGVGMAMICRSRGYRLILTMPETMSQERINLLKAYGAEVLLTPGAQGMTGSVAEANKLNKEIAGSVILGQFDNPSNPRAHYATTAEEIWQDTDGKTGMFVAGIGTGGTLCGTGKRLKELARNSVYREPVGRKELTPYIYIIGVEPASSPMITEGHAGAHKLQGIGANFIPKNYDSTVVDTVVAITNEEAIDAARLLSNTEGLLCGFSGGAALAALTHCPKCDGEAVVLLPDGGERYLSTELFK